jgi:hypothetical protein
VARISRLIGNLDTTAKGGGWQEAFVTAKEPEGGSEPMVFPANARKPLRRAAFVVLRWSLASRSGVGDGFPSRRLQAGPAGFPLKGRSLAVGLAWRLLCFKAV